ncbi:MAG: hypothetical protein ACK2U3_12930, partial [Anaerolineales bacterium]
AERTAHNRLVVGSIPTGPTVISKNHASYSPKTTYYKIGTSPEVVPKGCYPERRAPCRRQTKIRLD